MMLTAPHKIPLQEWIQRLSISLEKSKNSYDNELKDEIFILHNDKYLPTILNVTDSEFLVLCDRMRMYYDHIVGEMKKSGLNG